MTMTAEPVQHDMSNPDVVAAVEEANRHAAEVFAKNPSSILDEMTDEDLSNPDGFMFLGQVDDDPDDGLDDLIEEHFYQIGKI